MDNMYSFLSLAIFIIVIVGSWKIFEKAKNQITVWKSVYCSRGLFWNLLIHFRQFSQVLSAFIRFLHLLVILRKNIVPAQIKKGGRH